MESAFSICHKTTTFNIMPTKYQIFNISPKPHHRFLATPLARPAVVPSCSLNSVFSTFVVNKRRLIHKRNDSKLDIGAPPIIGFPKLVRPEGTIVVIIQCISKRTWTQ